MSDEEELIITPVPALVAVLFRLEQGKGSALTKAEVIEARDNSTCIALPKSAYEAMVKARGYDDIDADLAWEEWLGIRGSLHSSDEA